MSKQVRYVVLSVLLFSVLFFAAPAVFADTVRVSLSGSSVTVGVRTDGTVQFEGESFQMPGLAGEPRLPYRVLKILLPPRADLSTVFVSLENVIESEMGGFWDVPPVPSIATWDGEKAVVAWPEGRDIKDGRDVSIYGRDALFPQERTLPARAGEIRGWKVVDVPVALFRYNPVTRKLMRLEKAEVVVEFSGLTGKFAVNGTADTIAPDLVRNSVANYDEMVSAYTGDFDTSRRSGEAELPGYVIVTTRAIAGASDSLDEFVTHKENLGFDVSVATEADWGGGTGNEAADNVRSWLAENYLALNVKYVLLVGNPNPASGDVPMKMFWPMDGYDCPSDLYYSDLTGNWDLDGDGQYGEWGEDFEEGGIDTNWDVVVGRIPVYGSVADLDAILTKTIRYETAAPATVEWRRNVLLPMKPSDEDTPGYPLGEAIRADILAPLGNRPSCRVYEEDYGLDPAPEFTPCTVDNVTTAWTGGDFGFVAWWTHGSETKAISIMDHDHVSSLDDSHPSIVFQCSCFNAHPETPDNLSFSLLKNGAVLTVGATRASWYETGQTGYARSASNAGMAYEFSRRVVGHGGDCGTALATLKQETYVTCGSYWMNDTDFNLYGDPSLRLNVPGPSLVPVTVNIDGPDWAWWVLNRTRICQSGATVDVVGGTDCDISFSDAPGWVKPKASTITVPENGAVDLTFTYVERTLDGPTFVKPGGTGDGTSWDSPKDLADALRDSIEGEKILVAEGLYLPKYDQMNNRPLKGKEREATFTLQSGVELLGGFPADLTGTVSAGRDPSRYKTVLTGDLEGDDVVDDNGVLASADGIVGDNVLHVLYAHGVSDVLVDGMTVTGGKTEGGYGGGLCVSSGVFRAVDCAFTGNAADLGGGGVSCSHSTASLSGCEFAGNRAEFFGGGVNISFSEMTFDDCTFFANRARNGTALYSNEDAGRATNCTFSGNVDEGEGSALSDFGSSWTVTNCVFWDDTAREFFGGYDDSDVHRMSHCVVRGGVPDVWSADHVITEDPCLGLLADNGGITRTCPLLPGSSALDAGTAEGVLSCDQRGVVRPQGAGVDIGAYEVRPGALRVFLHGPAEALWSFDGDGGGGHGNGDTVSGLQIGTYPLTFSSVSGWNAPVSVDVTVTEGNMVLAAGDYTLAVDRPASWSHVEAGEDVTLEWEDFDVFEGSVDYEVYMEDEGSFVKVPAERVDGTSVTLDLNGHTTYTLRVDADGFEGEPWTFTTPNRAPRLVRRSPRDGADRLPADTVLSWLYVDPDGDSVDYNVYLGDGEALSMACSGDVTTFAPVLSCDCGYRWQIVASDRFEGMEAFEPGIASGDVWSFSAASDVHRITPPVPDAVLVAGGVNDVWVVTLASGDLAGLESALGEGVVPAGTVLSMDVEPLSGDVSSVDLLEVLGETGTSIAGVLSEGIRLAVTVSDDVNLVPIPMSLFFTEEQVGRFLSESTLLDEVHIFVIVGGQAFDLVALAGKERNSLFAVTSDVDESGVRYFVDFRLYLTEGGTSFASAASGSGGVSALTGVEDAAFLVEGASDEGAYRVSVTEATVEAGSDTGGGGCNVVPSAPVLLMLLLPLWGLRKK